MYGSKLSERAANQNLGTYKNVSFKHLPHLERELGLRENFFVDLEDDDDWSYTVKLHALMESSLAHLVLSALGNAKLERIVHSLPLGNKRNGKLAFAISLEVLSDADLTFIQFVSELRNGIVHRIQNVDFSFDKHFKAKQDSEIKQIYVGWGLAKIEGNDGDTFLEMFRLRPKMFIHLRAIMLFELIYLRHSIKKYRNLMRGQYEELVESISDAERKKS